VSHDVRGSTVHEMDGVAIAVTIQNGKMQEVLAAGGYFQADKAGCRGASCRSRSV